MKRGRRERDSEGGGGGETEKERVMRRVQGGRIYMHKYIAQNGLQKYSFHVHVHVHVHVRVQSGVPSPNCCST